MPDEQAEKYRNNEEQSTQQRAALLGVRYLDSRSAAKTSPLVPDVLTIDEMYRGKLVPLQAGTDDQPYIFAITSSTPQSVMKAITKSFNDNGRAVNFLLISNLGFRDFMLRYDPPKEVHYDDVKIARDGDSDTLAEVSKTLESVSTEKILDYLIDQADQLGASDIHIENQREDVRVRLRVDGALHPIAAVSHDKYRALQGSLATRANISTAANEPQTGHMQQTSLVDPEKIINMRIETVPTSYGMDVVIRLFNFDESMLDLEKLGLSESSLEQIQNIIKHPHGLVLVVGPTGSGKSTTMFSIINAMKVTGKNLTDCKIVIIGAGAAGTAITKLLHRYGVGSIIAVDSQGIVGLARTDLNSEKTALLEFVDGSQSGTLDDAITNADIFIGVSKPGLLTIEMVQKMAKDPIVFALSNPEPEIMPDVARAAGVAVIATGRSDFPNQVNNAIAFPGIFRGALDNGVKTITDDHKLAAAEAIASLVAYPTADEIIPSVFDTQLVPTIAAVIK